MFESPTSHPTTAVHCLHGLVRDRGPADRILYGLKEAGFAPTAISILFVDRRTLPRPSAAGMDLVPPPESSTDIRGFVAELAGARAVPISGAASFIVAGPLAEVFHPSTVRDAAAALSTFGLSEPVAANFARRVVDGAFLIIVHSNSVESSQRARALFVAEHADQITPGIGDLGPVPGTLPALDAGGRSYPDRP